MSISLLQEKIEYVLSIAHQYGGCEGAHHKQWVIDQMIRALSGYQYEAWVRDYEAGGAYKWEVGIPP